MANEYLTSSNFTDVASSILSKKQSDYKSRAKKALVLDFVNNFLGQANQGLIQEKEEAINEVLTKYDSIFKINQEQFNQFDRAKIDEYTKSRETFLNKEAASRINNSNFATENNITWQNRMNENSKIQKQLIETFNSLRDEIDEEYKILQTNPKYTNKTSEEYNSLAKEQLLAELSLVKNDPRRKSLIKKFWNNTFRNKKDPDGNLVSTNPEIIELEEAVSVAKFNRNTFRQRVKDSDLALEEYYKNLTNKSLDELKTVIKTKTKIFTETELEAKTSNTIKYFINDKGEFTNFGTTKLFIDIEGKNKNNQEITNTIDIKEKIREDEVIVLNENGEKEPLSQSILFESIALKRLDMSYQLEQKNQNPLVGPTAIHAALESFNQNGRFKVDGKNIIFIPPGIGIQNNVDADDASALLQKNGKSPEDTLDISQSNEQIVPRYSTATALNFIEDLRLKDKSEEEIKIAANNIKNLYSNNKGVQEEVDLIVNSTRLEFLKMKKDELVNLSTSTGFRRFMGKYLPSEEMYRFADLGTIEELNKKIKLLEEEK